MQEETMAQGEVSLRDYLDLLRRRSITILQTFAAALVIGIVVALVSQKVYRSEGRLLVTQQNPTVSVNNLSDVFSGAYNNSSQHNIETQLRILLNGSLQNRAFEAAGQSPGDPRISISVTNEKDIDIISVAAEAPNPVAAANVANSLMNLYIADSTEERNRGLRETIAFAEKTLRDANDTWNKAANALVKFQNRKGVSDLDKALNSQTDQLSQIELHERDAQASIDGTQAEIDTIKEQMTSLPKTYTTTQVSTNPQIAALEGQLIGKRADLQATLQLFKSDYPKVKSLKAEIADLEAALAKAPPTVRSETAINHPAQSELQGKLRGLAGEKARRMAELARVVGRRTELLASVKDLGGLQTERARLMMKRDNAQETVKTIESRLTDLRIRTQAQVPLISKLGDAPVNNVPVRPNRPLTIFLSALTGLFLGVCFALLQEFLDDRVNSPEDARRMVGVPALGYIPRIEQENRRLLSSDSTGGAVLESYRVLRSNVRFAAVGEPLHSLMVTSAMPGEGKSQTAANLAIAMALDGRKVILVDADLRRPTVHEKFSVRNTPGLTNVLVGQMTLDEALRESGIENLRLLVSGPIPPNPAEMLNSQAMERVQEELKTQCDLVIFDSPPCLSVADAQVLAASVDGLIFVIQLGSTRKSAMRHGFELLRQAHARVLGVVYNKITVEAGRNKYYYGYYTAYHKAELPGKSKSNGNGTHRGDDDEMESLPASKKAEATAVVEATPEQADPRSSSRPDREKG